MVNDLKTVPCSIYNPQDPATEGKVTERHRAILIEWLLEVATEEKYRRYNLPLIFSKPFMGKGTNKLSIFAKIAERSFATKS
jgi:hypothetical protein